MQLAVTAARLNMTIQRTPHQPRTGARVFVWACMTNNVQPNNSFKPTPLRPAA